MTQDDYVVMKRSSREKLIRELKKVKKENQQLKKQKDDVTQYIKEHEKIGDLWSVKVTDDLLRMLGEENV